MEPSRQDAKTYDEREEVDRAALPAEAPTFPQLVPSRLPRELFYDFRDKRGLAVILNHFQYNERCYRDLPPPRHGTHSDVKRLRHTLESLNFTVEPHTDLTYNQIIDVMLDVSQRKHTETSCLVVCVLTHGEAGGRLLAADREYSTRELFCHFTSDACPGLAAAPKLFFIQACRGKRMDDGVQMDSEISDSIKLPTTANFLMMYSTVEDFVSWRDSNGSWFIQALCDELEKSHEHMDLLHMLTLVNWRVAYYRASYVPTNLDKDDKKQMPQLVSTLTKFVRFGKD